MSAGRGRVLGIALCAVLVIPCWLLGTTFPIIGGPVFSILLGMAVAAVWGRQKRGALQGGVAFTAKKVLQWAVILLGFGLNLAQIAAVGATSLPIICSTIATALIAAYIMHRLLHTDSDTATLIGVGSSICGGSAIAATAPVIHAKDEDVAQAISVIFLFNVVAALIFPSLGMALGMSNEGFALFAGTAVNDTSSVTAAAAAWDGMHPGSNALDDATIVKLTRTLAIIPITLVLAVLVARREQKAAAAQAAEAGGADRPAKQSLLAGFSLKRALPSFIILFVLASLLTTVLVAFGADASMFAPLKTLSKYFICMAMLAIGLNTDIVKLVRSGGKPILMGLACWVCIAAVSLGMQYALGLW
uniref:YeiH family protein n=1 Tax=Muribaculaceae bacterium Z82 TaxID=2304548 RepID=A0A7C9JEE6_9BACT